MKIGDIINANLKLKVEESKNGCNGCFFDSDMVCTNPFNIDKMNCNTDGEDFIFTLIKEEVKND